MVVGSYSFLITNTMLLEWHTLDTILNMRLLALVPEIPLAVITVYTCIGILNWENESYCFSPFLDASKTVEP